MDQLIKNIVARKTRMNSHRTRYRSPLVGFASADDPLFGQLRQVAHPDHLLPKEMLPDAKTVIAFFLPFETELVKLNRNHPYVSREWAEAYVETNGLIKEICQEIERALAELGFQTTYEMPTHNFDQELLLSPWSHKHVAFVCGLGSFGRNTMLITEKGCAGRFGSLVTDGEISSDRPVQEAFFAGCEKCNYCVKACPVLALGEKELDKAACYRHLLKVNEFYDDLSLSDACGKCANGPCATKSFSSHS